MGPSVAGLDQTIVMTTHDLPYAHEPALRERAVILDGSAHHGRRLRPTRSSATPAYSRRTTPTTGPTPSLWTIISKALPVIHEALVDPMG